MKQVYLANRYLIIMFLSFSAITEAQKLLAEQNFEESASDTWSPIASPTPYVVGTDVWNKIPALNEINPQTNTNFWGMWDLENPNGGGTDVHILDFPNVSVVGELNIQASFYFYTVGFDSGDYLRVEFFFDNVSQGIDELDKNSMGWTKFSKIVPNGTNNVRFKTMAYQNGSNDYAAIDNITLKSGMVLGLQNDEIESFSIYPNPVKGNLITLNTLNNRNKFVEIYDLYGKQVLMQELESNEKTIFHNLNSGIYFIKVEEEYKISTKKLIIK